MSLKTYYEQIGPNTEPGGKPLRISDQVENLPLSLFSIK